MKKFKEILKTTSNNLVKFIKKFPITLCVIILTTIFLIIGINSNMALKVTTFAVILAFETLFIETYFKNRILKGVLSGVGAIVSLLFVFFLNIESGFLVEYKSMIMTNTILILACYLIMLFMFTIYKLIKISNLGVSGYLIKVFSNLFNSTIIYFILNTGLLIISSIFVLLILDSKGFDIVLRIQIGLLGLFYIPAILMSLFTVNKKEVNLFIKSIVVYISLPLVCLAVLIIYIYMAKIFLLKDIPSNVIYRILSGIFVVGFPVMYMASNYKDENKFFKYTLKILPYLFIPFIFLQVYSIVARYLDKGITPMRYISYAFLIFEVVLLALTIFRSKKKMECMVIASSIILVITFVSPFNLISVSNMNQSHILKKAFGNETSFNNLSNDDKSKVKSSYKYLRSQYNYKKYIPEYISQSEKDILGYIVSPKNNKTIVETAKISIDDETMDISKYSKITRVKIFENADFDLNSLELKDYNKNTMMEINLNYLINDVISGNLNEEKINAQNPIKIDENKDLFINSLVIKYEKENKKVKYVSFSGYLLEK